MARPLFTKAKPSRLNRYGSNLQWFSKNGFICGSSTIVVVVLIPDIQMLSGDARTEISQ